MNFTQQYGKNRQRCQQNTLCYAVRQLLLYFYREFPSKMHEENITVYHSFIKLHLYEEAQWSSFSLPIKEAFGNIENSNFLLEEI